MATQRAAIYARLSKKADTIDLQLTEAAGHVHAQAFTYDETTDLYVDNGHPKGRQPAFEQLLANADRYDVVAVLDLCSLYPRGDFHACAQALVKLHEVDLELSCAHGQAGADHIIELLDL